MKNEKEEKVKKELGKNERKKLTLNEEKKKGESVY